MADRHRTRPGVTTATGPVRFDPLDPAFVASPYEQYAVLRHADPVHWSDLLCGWVLTRYDDVAATLRDPSMSSDIRNATPTPIVELELEGLAQHGRASRTIVHLDDPDHARVRKLMAEPFRVREINRLGGLVDEHVAAALDRLGARLGDGGETVVLDLVGDLAYPLPVEIFSAWLGMPDESTPQFRRWTGWVARSRDPMPPDERAEFYAALDSMHDYLAAQAEARRHAPTGDLLSYLVHTEDGGEQLTHDELMSQLVTLYMAGHEPTASVVANGILALLRHPSQLDRLRADPDLLRNAVSELLRYDGPNQFVRRITTQPTRLGGVEVPAGAVLYVGLASANRDPRRWGPDADTVVIDRPDAGQHLQFGGGAHACLGSHLARLQAERMLAAFLRRLDDLELGGEPVWSTRMFIRGLHSLPVRCSVRP
jgi:cytochrome P450